MVNVVCTLWGDAFPACYVTVLRNAVAANLTKDHRFFCVTDNPSALGPGIEGVQMPEMGIPLQYRKQGCWPKLSIFAPGVLPADNPTLYLDLDLMVQGDLSPFFDRIIQQPGFHALREWNPTLWSLVPLSMRPHRGVQGSLLGFIPKQQYGIYERFMADPEAAWTKYPLDQDFLTDTVASSSGDQPNEVHDWPFEWTASFKWHCLKYYPLNRIMPKINRPQRAKVVVFHGNPRPIDVVPLGDYRWGTKRKFGFGPVDWVREYWLRHDPTWTDDAPQIRAAA